MTTPKPREFWINTQTCEVHYTKLGDEFDINVVEKSAYDKAIAALKHLRDIPSWETQDARDIAHAALKELGEI